MQAMRTSLRTALLGLAALAAAACAHRPPAAAVPATPERWKTVFLDDFDGPDGSPPDPRRWVFDTGGWGFGNQEREYYRNGTDDAFQQGGVLHLVAREGAPAGLRCWYGACTHTSARIKTKGRFAFTYGKVSARIEIPKGQGIWPAFWMLGADIDGVSWPSCGEVDVMEVIGKEPRIAHGTIHGPGYSGARGPSSTWSPAKGEVGDAFHVFAVDWEPARLRFYVDGELYATRTPRDLPSGERWVFDHDFFLLLNVAVGGTWPGDPDRTTRFPAEMLVDWVRVEERDALDANR
jgi:beta-glucanase (GH16 family)